MNWPPEQRGTYAMVGVATALAPLESHGAGTLGRGSCTIRARGPMPPNIQPNLRVRLLVVLDMEEETPAYATGGTHVGPAFRGWKGRTLYPAVNAVCGQCQVCISYLGESRGEAWGRCDECSVTGGCDLGWKLNNSRKEQVFICPASYSYSVAVMAKGLHSHYLI